MEDRWANENKLPKKPKIVQISVYVDFEHNVIKRNIDDSSVFFVCNWALFVQNNRFLEYVPKEHYIKLYNQQ